MLSITQATSDDIIRCLDDPRLLANMHIKLPEHVHCRKGRCYLITNGTDEMVLVAKNRTDLSKSTGIMIAEVHMVCPRRSIRSVRIMCKAIMKHLACDGYDILITDCTKGTVVNTGKKLGFHEFGSSDRDTVVMACNVRKLRND